MLTAILAAAGYIDFKKRKIPNCIILLLALYALFFAAGDPLSKLISFALVFIPCITIAVITDKLKGGDVKFIAALSSCIGVFTLAEILAITMALSFLYTGITKERSVPLAFIVFLSWIMLNTIKYLFRL